VLKRAIADQSASAQIAAMKKANGPIRRSPIRAMELRGEMPTLARFLLVGIVNTLIGYGFILIWMWIGSGDYLANLAGFLTAVPISYLLHRRLTFAARKTQTWLEALRYSLAFAVAYGCNFAVITAGHSLGYFNNPAVQLAGIAAYAAIFFVLLRLTVFYGPAKPPRGN